MFHDYHHRRQELDTLAADVHAAIEASPDLMSRVVAATARRSYGLHGAAGSLHSLIEAGALTEAALGLIEQELPQWKLRRIAYDEGEWHCAMSQQRELPDWLDQAVEAHHGSLTLAILGAYLEAAIQTEDSRAPRRPSVPQSHGGYFGPLFCDNVG